MVLGEGRGTPDDERGLGAVVRTPAADNFDPVLSQTEEEENTMIR